MSTSRSRSDADAIEAVCARFTEAANSSDADLWASAYSADAVLLPPHHAPVHGRDAVRDYMNQAFFGVFTVAMQDQTEALVVDGDLAFRRGSVTLKLTPKNGDPAIDDSVSYLEVWERQEDGSWQLTQDIFNSNQPPA